MKKYECPWQSKELAKEMLNQLDTNPCEDKCPLNKSKTCYRWDICFIGISKLREVEDNAKINRKVNRLLRV